MNDQGQIIGGSTTVGAAASYESHAFLWEKGVMTDLTPNLGANETSTAAGHQRARPGNWLLGLTDPGSCRGGCATLWENGAIIDLEYDGQGFDFLSLMDDRGQIVGYGNYHPSSWVYGYYLGRPCCGITVC